MRIRGFPFGEEVHEFITGHEHVFVIEQNRDAQLRAAGQIELGVAARRMTPVLDYGGMPLTRQGRRRRRDPSPSRRSARMTSIAKPPVRHPSSRTNGRGLTLRDYEGAMSTLCAGCGHDSVTAALVQAGLGARPSSRTASGR
jgi:hypothetical protein